MNNSHLTKLLAEFKRNCSAPELTIQAAADALKTSLPRDFAAFLGTTNGGEGMVGDTYVMLWRAEELADMNLAYQVEEYAPGLLLIGSDGGGEAFAFDTRTSPWPVVKVPFVGMDVRYVKILGQSFDEFLHALAG